MQLLHLLLYILLILLPFGVILRFEIVPTVYIYPSDIVAFLISLWIIVKVLKSKANLRASPFFLPVYCFVIICLLSLLASYFSYSASDLFVGFLYLIRFILYINLIFAGFFLRERYKLRILYALLFAGFVFGIMGVLQYILFPDLRGLEYLGWDEHYYRLFSTFFDPNYTGALYVLILILSYGIYCSSLLTPIKKVIPFFMTLMLVGLFLTYSRSSYIMLLVTFIAYFVITKQKVLIFALLVIAVCGLVIIPKDIHSEGVDLFRTASINSRINSMKTAVSIFSKSPILGTGFNMYRYAQEKYGLIDINSRLTHAGGGASNSFLLVLATTGVIGILFYLNYWIQIVKKLFDGVALDGYRTLFSAVISSVVGLFAHSLFENTQFFVFIMIWIYLLIGIVVSLEEK